MPKHTDDEKRLLKLSNKVAKKTPEEAQRLIEADPMLCGRVEKRNLLHNILKHSTWNVDTSDLCERMLEAGHTLHNVDNRGRTPFLTALHASYAAKPDALCRKLCWMLDHGCPVDSSSSGTILSTIAMLNRMRVLKGCREMWELLRRMVDLYILVSDLRGATGDDIGYFHPIQICKTVEDARAFDELFRFDYGKLSEGLLGCCFRTNVGVDILQYYHERGAPIMSRYAHQQTFQGLMSDGRWDVLAWAAGRLPPALFCDARNQAWCNTVSNLRNFFVNWTPSSHADMIRAIKNGHVVDPNVGIPWRVVNMLMITWDDFENEAWTALAHILNENYEKETGAQRERVKSPMRVGHIPGLRCCFSPHNNDPTRPWVVPYGVDTDAWIANARKEAGLDKTSCKVTADKINAFLKEK